MYTLGISAFYHDSAAVLLKDGKVICALEEERFSRVKHDSDFPFQSIDHCLSAAGILINQVEHIAYYEKPLLKFERILENFSATYPFALKSFLKGMPEWLGTKIKVEQIIRKKLGYKNKLYFVPHHLSHAAAAFYPSSFEQAAVLTIDGVGEYQTTALWRGGKDSLSLLKYIDFPHSLGLVYSTFTAFLGFKVNEDEYKVMGLAAYGRPVYLDNILNLINLQEDGSFLLDMDYFSFRNGSRMWSNKFIELFGQPRDTKDLVTERDKNLAASIQAATEQVYFSILKHLQELTGSFKVCVGGGLALNALANGKIFSQTKFNKVYILGVSGDSGAALGAALYVQNILVENSVRVEITTQCLGTSYADDEIEEYLKTQPVFYKKLPTISKIVESAARDLSMGKIIGWFQGDMEFGPRALGARSILSSASPRSMKDRVNEVKIREMFRPFAGSILEERTSEYFEIPSPGPFPFMNFCFIVKEDKRKELAAIVYLQDSNG
jgi:carbamoyltransferase